MQIDECIRRINNNDSNLTEINLSNQQLEDHDVAPLMSALANNTAAATRITKLDLSWNRLTSINVQILTALKILYLHHNKLTSFNLQGLRELKYLTLADNQLTNITLKDLSALEWAQLQKNQFTSVNIQGLATLKILLLENNILTAAVVIALKTLSAKEGFTLRDDYQQLRANTPLTSKMLDEHFKPLLTIKNDTMNSYIDKALVMLTLPPVAPSLATKTLLSLPIELMRETLKYEVTEVAQANLSVANFKNIFSNLPTAPVMEKQQLNTLIAYEETKLKKLIKNTEKSYDNMFTNLQKSCEAIRARASTCVNVYPCI